jgi:drug/metabolite transporter (DMT)-like permease
VVSSLFGVLIMATALAPIFGFVDRSRPGSPFAYLAALAAGVVAAALGMWFQYRQQRRHPNASADEPAQA